MRRLRFKHTLVARSGGGWRLDLSSRKDGHKTSKYYGPYCTALPEALNGLLNRLRDALALEGEGGDEAYLFGPNHSIDRPYESAAWTMAVKRAFQKHHGREVAPKTLRSSFITWLRSETTCPEVLKVRVHAKRRASCQPDGLGVTRVAHASLIPSECRRAGGGARAEAFRASPAKRVVRPGARHAAGQGGIRLCARAWI